MVSETILFWIFGWLVMSIILGAIFVVVGALLQHYRLKRTARKAAEPRQKPPKAA